MSPMMAIIQGRTQRDTIARSVEAEGCDVLREFVEAERAWAPTYWTAARQFRCHPRRRAQRQDGDAGRRRRVERGGLSSAKR
jgi:hypothetical protein